jgi:hypothetical protein
LTADVTTAWLLSVIQARLLAGSIAHAAGLRSQNALQASFGCALPSAIGIQAASDWRIPFA